MSKDNNWAKKEIILGDSYRFVEERNYKGYKVFEIPLGKSFKFTLDVKKAINEDATKIFAYWVVQDHKKFGSTTWLGFLTNYKTKGIVTRTEDANAENNLFEHLNKLNEPNYRKQQEALAQGEQIPERDIIRKFIGQKGVGKHFRMAYKNVRKDINNKRSELVAVPRELTFKIDKVGEAFWLEIINYYPEFADQGAFIVGVDTPQILSFFVEKRTKAEHEVDADGVIDKNTDAVEQQLVYGDILDIHLRLHRTTDYTASLEVFQDGKPMDQYARLITLKPKLKKGQRVNPALEYNLEIIDELVVDLRWAEKSGHEEGEDNEDSLQQYKMVLTLTPIEKKEYKGENRPTLKKEVTFTVNYKGDFSYDIHEPEYVAQVIKVNQPPLITQSYESCKYTELTILQNNKNPISVLKEETDGSLTEKCKDDYSLFGNNNTPYYELVAGNDNNVQEVTIQVDKNKITEYISECENEISHKEHDKHPNNIFSTSSVPVYDYNKKQEDTIWGKIKSFIPQNNIFGNIQPYQEISREAHQLKFKAAYPYNAYSLGSFLGRFLTLQMSPVSLDITVQTCRYVRTPKLVIYPDTLWAVHLNYNVAEEDIIYHNNVKVELVSGYADYISYIAVGVDWLNDKIKPFVETFIPATSKETQEIWKTLQEAIKEFVEDSKSVVDLGFHAIMDNNKDKPINYSQIKPFYYYLNGMIFSMVVLSIAIDALLLYLTAGKVSPGLLRLAQAAKKFKKVSGKIQKFKDKNDLTIQMPRVSMNSAFYKEQYAVGKVATILEYTIKADPLIAINKDFAFNTKKLPGPLKKFKVTAITSGEIKFDVNVRYNTKTGEFTLNNNAPSQGGSGDNKLRDGDITQAEGKIKIKLKAEGALKKEFELWDFFPIATVKAEGKLDLNTALGVTHRIGVDKNKGIYTEFFIFFDGIRGKYKQNVDIEVLELEWSSNPDDTEEEISVFEKSHASLGKMYIFEIFNSKTSN